MWTTLFVFYTKPCFIYVMKYMRVGSHSGVGLGGSGGASFFNISNWRVHR